MSSFDIKSLGDISISFSGLFSESFIEKQSELYFSTQPLLVSESGELEVITYSISRYPSSIVFLSNGTTTVAHDIPATSPSILTVESSLIDLIATDAMFIRANNSNVDLVYKKDKSKAWSLNRISSDATTQLLFTSGSVAAPSANSLLDTITRSINTNTDFLFYFALITESDLIDVVFSTISDYALLANSLDDIKNYTVAELYVGTFVELMTSDFTKTQITQTYSDLAQIKLPELNSDLINPNYTTTEFNYIFLCEQNTDTELVAMFSLTDIMSLPDNSTDINVTTATDLAKMVLTTLDLSLELGWTII